MAGDRKHTCFDEHGNSYVKLAAMEPQVLMMELIDFAREQGSVGRDIQELIAKALAEASISCIIC